MLGQRCDWSPIDDVEHVVSDCADLEAERLKHQVYLTSAILAFSITLAACVYIKRMACVE